MKVKIINRSKNPLPQYETENSAGMDLRADIVDDIIINPLERVLVPTGLFIELPKGFEGQVRPRSGLAAKNGITVLNSPGTIDSDYRGEIKVILVNLSNDPFVLSAGERVCQLVIAKHETIAWEETIILSDTVRGEGGFGHTGLN
ncbi:MAG: dUTP diphosphatase [Bacteroidales bacterium]|nr:dUTP diphosphatase [Bacteroidales bacterium]